MNLTPNRNISNIEGDAALPRKNGELVFHEAWERRAFALAVVLCEQGHYQWDEFHDHLIAVALETEVDDVYDVLVIKGRGRLGFENEAAREVFVVGKVLVQTLNGDDAVQGRLDCLEQNGGTAGGNGANDLYAFAVRQRLFTSRASGAPQGTKGDLRRESSLVTR